MKKKLTDKELFDRLAGIIEPVTREYKEVIPKRVKKHKPKK
jgi:hypothetical protein